MIRGDKVNAALLAIHDLVVRARFMALTQEDHERIAALLDKIEYLPTLMLSSADETDLFRRCLEDIAANVPDCRWALQRYLGQAVSDPDSSR